MQLMMIGVDYLVLNRMAISFFIFTWGLLYSSILLFSEIDKYRVSIFFWEIGITLFMACLYYSSNKNLPLLFFILGKVLFVDLSQLGMILLYNIAIPDDVRFDYLIISFSGWWTLSFVLCFFCKNKTHSVIPETVDYNVIKLAIIIFFSISIGTALALSLFYTGSLFGFLLSGYADRSSQVNSNFLYPLQYFAMGCIPLVSLILIKEKMVSIWWLVLAAIIVYFIFKGSRSWVLVSVLTFLLVMSRFHTLHTVLKQFLRFNRINKCKLRHVLSLVFLIFIIISMTGTRQEGFKIQTFHMLEKTISGSILQGKAGLDGGQVAIRIIKALQEHRLEYLYGGSYWATLVNPIPRIIWPSKPVAFSAMVMPIVDPTGHANRSPTFFIEAYANFGFFGPPLVALCFGVAMAVLSRKMDWRFQLILIQIVPFLLLEVRGDFLSITIPMIMSIIPIILAINFALPTKKKSRGRTFINNLTQESVSQR